MIEEVQFSLLPNVLASILFFTSRYLILCSGHIGNFAAVSIERNCESSLIYELSFTYISWLYKTRVLNYLRFEYLK